MAGYRLERVAKQIRQAVSDALIREVSDPRVRGLVTVTRVDCAPDLRSARVYVSVMGKGTSEKTVLAALQHAHGHIQQHVAASMTMKVCPVLDFQLDEGYKKTLETLEMIRQANADQEQSKLTAAPDDHEQRS